MPSPRFSSSSVDKDDGESQLFIRSDLDALLTAVGRHKDRDAFVKIFEYFAPRIKSFLMKGGASPDQAEEWVQDTMITIWDRAETYNSAHSAASTWIFTIARNKKIDALRKSKYHHYDPNDIMESIKDDKQIPADMRVNAQEQEAHVAKAIAALPPEQADLIRMSFFDGMAHGDIAAKTKLPLGTVKSRIRLALDRLRRETRLTQNDITG